MNRATGQIETLPRANEIQGRRLRPYPEYRDVDMKNIPVVPAHWECVPLKSAVSLNAVKLPDSTDPDYEIDYVDIGNVSLVEGITSRERLLFADAPSRARRRVEDGDTIISTVRTYLKAVAHIVDPPENLLVSTGFAVLRPGCRFDDAYLYRLVQSEPFIQRVVAHSVGISYPAINPSELGGFTVPVPSLPEQRAIAAFLDRKTREIDELIAKKRRLIELLQEKLTALISHAVTGALILNDAAAWQRMQLGRAIKLQRGFDITGASDGNGAIPVISSGGISGSCEVPMVQGPGVVVGRKGTLGTVHYIDTAYWPHDTTLWVRQFRGNIPRFVFYFLIYMQLERFDVGAANPTVNRNHVHPVPVSWPDVASQHAIATFLDGETSKVANLISRIDNAVSKLSEYRSALISAAVTGTIDVREEEPSKHVG